MQFHWSFYDEHEIHLYILQKDLLFLDASRKSLKEAAIPTLNLSKKSCRGNGTSSRSCYQLKK